jgi:hypothetical protein
VENDGRGAEKRHAVFALVFSSAQSHESDRAGCIQNSSTNRVNNRERENRTKRRRKERKEKKNGETHADARKPTNFSGFFSCTKKTKQRNR